MVRRLLHRPAREDVRLDEAVALGKQVGALAEKKESLPIGTRLWRNTSTYPTRSANPTRLTTANDLPNPQRPLTAEHCTSTAVRAPGDRRRCGY
jgi:hypothetical protein